MTGAISNGVLQSGASTGGGGSWVTTRGNGGSNEGQERERERVSDGERNSKGDAVRTRPEWQLSHATPDQDQNIRKHVILGASARAILTACKCGKVGRVGNRHGRAGNEGGRKELCTLWHGAKLRMHGHLDCKRVGLKTLGPRMDVACWGTQSVSFSGFKTPKSEGGSLYYYLTVGKLGTEVLKRVGVDSESNGGVSVKCDFWAWLGLALGAWAWL
ncbi:hypothetical protein EDB85DRAFT_2281767 [Lactarius pseudohatsudake]|nr:hypothetical protein EDB85DRAFT_2281767 [Lactarius pseudohatsudake]